jgi:hypothetical protein
MSPPRLPHRSVAAPKIRSAALVAVVVFAGIADVSTARATSGSCRQKPVASSPGQSQSVQQDLVAPGAVSVTLCRYRGLNDPTPQHVNELAGSATVTDPTSVQSLSEQFDALPPDSGPQHASACPADDASSMVATFDYPHAAPDAVSIRLTGCSLATNGAVAASMAFDGGQRLRSELTKLTGCRTTASSWLCNSDPLPTVKVPHVLGLDVAAAYRQLHRAGLRVTLPGTELDYGLHALLRVTGQSRPGGASASRGGIVRLKLGCPRCGVASPGVPKPLPQYRVPSFVGRSVGDARRWVAHKALYLVVHLGPLRGGNAADLLDNYRVIRQRPRAGRNLGLGTAMSCCGGSAGSFTPTPLVVWGTQS